MGLSLRRTKRVKNERPYPDSWEVSTDWNGMVSREHEFTLKGDSQTQWYLFLRFVHNTDNGAKWVDAIRMKPYDAFTAHRPDRIGKIRKRRAVVISS